MRIDSAKHASVVSSRANFDILKMMFDIDTIGYRANKYCPWVLLQLVFYKDFEIYIKSEGQN